MKNWKNDISIELRRAKEAERVGNEGRLRTIARRIAGMALKQLKSQLPQLQLDSDYLSALYAVKKSGAVPQHVADAATRLVTRIAEDFKSPSKDPLGDAMIIVEYVERQLKRQ
ncbi:MAG: hypothetical protein KGJ59_01680 [Bacteroidota bacterium]|nr:hypothetical protein [Bacteroidota bacterium]